MKIYDTWVARDVLGKQPLTIHLKWVKLWELTESQQSNSNSMTKSASMIFLDKTASLKLKGIRHLQLAYKFSLQIMFVASD